MNLVPSPLLPAEPRRDVASDPSLQNFTISAPEMVSRKVSAHCTSMSAGRVKLHRAAADASLPQRRKDGRVPRPTARFPIPYSMYSLPSTSQTWLPRPLAMKPGDSDRILIVSLGIGMGAPGMRRWASPRRRLDQKLLINADICQTLSTFWPQHSGANLLIELCALQDTFSLRQFSYEKEPKGV